MWVADWVLSQSGVDPAAALRGSYANEDEAKALIAGGLVAVVDAQAVLDRTDAPRPGDVGIITVSGNEVAAILSDNGWAFRQFDGIGVIRTDPAAAWALPVQVQPRMDDAPEHVPAPVED